MEVALGGMDRRQVSGDRNLWLWSIYFWDLSMQLNVVERSKASRALIFG